MKFFSKKISLGAGLAVLFVVSSGVYSLGYKIAMNKFNDLVSYTQEKQKMYENLSEIDYLIRNEYIGNIDESKILEGIYIGYLGGVDDVNCKFFRRSDYLKYTEEKKNQPGEVLTDKFKNGSIGYIKIGSLGKGSGDEFIKTVDSFKSEQIDKIIIDLRTSYGGIMEEGFKILKYLAPEGDLVYTLKKSGEKAVVCSSDTPRADLKVVILTSNYSWGAAEVVASGLKDSINAKIVGQITSGNAATEKMVEINEESVIVFPDATYVTLGNNNFYGKGLSQDQIVNMDEKKEILLHQSKLSYEEDDQLQTAINVIDE